MEVSISRTQVVEKKEEKPACPAHSPAQPLRTYIVPRRPYTRPPAVRACARESVRHCVLGGARDI